MKTFENKRKALKVLTIVLSAVLIAMTMNACGNKKDGGGGDGGPGAPPPGPNGCVNCPPGTGQIIASAFGVHNPNTISIGLSFFAQGQTQGNSYYAGPVVATGELFVGPQAGSQYCPLNAGVYTLTTTQPGNWSNSMIYNMRLDGNGPGGRVSLVLINDGVYSAQPMIQYNGRTYPNHLWGNVLIESVNGQPCQPQYPYFVQ